MNESTEAKLPKYIQLAQQVREQIESGELKPGDRMASFVEMRTKFGMSQAVLERAYALLEEEGRIVRQLGSGIYVARPARLKNKAVLGYLHVGGSEGSHSYYVHLLEGVREAARREGQELMLLDDVPSLGSERVDGLLVHGDGARDIHDRIPPGMPAVGLMATANDVPGVLADDYDGVCQATRHLLELGHRRIGYLIDIMEAGDTTRQRFDGYRRTLHAEGILLDPNLVGHLANYGPMVRRGYRSMREWLNAGWRQLGCTALLVQNDQAAMGAMQALQEAGMQVPHDISVVGYDGAEECEFARPHLTSVGVPLRQIGFEAAELLLVMIRAETTVGPNRILPTALQIRDSTARVRTC